jgi:hypothetical protein
VQVELKSQSRVWEKEDWTVLADCAGLDGFNASRAVGSRTQEEREKSLKESKRDSAQEG